MLLKYVKKVNGPSELYPELIIIGILYRNLYINFLSQLYEVDQVIAVAIRKQAHSHIVMSNSEYLMAKTNFTFASKFTLYSICCKSNELIFK